MPAKSQAQQQAAGIEYGRRKRGKKPRRFKSMSTEDLRHLASTRRKGLPYRAKSNRRRAAEIRSGR